MNMNLTSATHPYSPATLLTTELLDVYEQLSARPDLRPGPQVNALFGRLVGAVVEASDDTATHVLADPQIQAIRHDLRHLCSLGETELERSWAAGVAASRRPREELARFPYLGNYRRLVRMELNLVATHAGRPVRSVAFVGAGPLPMTALLLAGELGVPVDLVDRDPSALAAARGVVEALGYADFGFVAADAADAGLRDYDVVVLAAMVGQTPAEKAPILRRVAASMRPGALLLARSARSLRTLLYAPLDLETLPDLDVLDVVHPRDDVVNSVVVARVRPSGEW